MTSVGDGVRGVASFGEASDVGNRPLACNRPLVSTGTKRRHNKKEGVIRWKRERAPEVRAQKGDDG